MYNIYFEAAAAGFVGVLLLYLYIQYPDAAKSNLRYRRMVTWLLLSEILDVITAVTIDHGERVPPIANTLLNTAYFLVCAKMGFSYVLYLDSFLYKERRSIIYRINVVIFRVYTVLLLGNMFLGYCFYFDENGTYIHGPAYPFTYGVLLVVCVMGLINIYIHRKELEHRQIIASWLFLVFTVAGSTLQIFLFPYTLLTMYMASLAVMVFLFAIETPDYQKLQKTMKELEQAKLEAQEQYEKAETASQTKSLFLAKMSHEIRTPINAVIGMNEMILREEQDVEIQEYAMDVKRSADSLLSTINDILDLSKIESGKMELIPVEYDVSSLLHDVINMISMKAADKNLEIRLSLDEKLPSRLYGDDVRIRQILVNILNNAVKYTEKGSVSLSVRTTFQDETAVIHFEVEDTGIGIRKEDMQRLFSVYSRIEENRNRMVEGTGLGMNITQQLLHLMGSRLEVDSVYGQGSCFYFDLEQRIIDFEPIGNLEQRIREQTEQYSYNASFTAPNARILLVDDNSVNRKVCISLLKETLVNIDEASGGLECLEKVKEQHYDLILLDHMMPDMDGIETLKAMQSLEDFPCINVPVIALTANAISGAKEMYLQTGFSDFLSKPIRPEKLERMLTDYLPKELVCAGNPERKKKFSSVPSADILEKLPDMDGIDWEYALLHMKDLAILEATILDFIEIYMTEQKKLESWKMLFDQSGETELLQQYRIQVHSMKSNAAMLGAVTVSSLAKMLEYAARDGKVEIIHRLHSVFIGEWELLGSKLREFYKKTDREVEMLEPDEQKIMEYLTAIALAMEEYDVDTADEMIQRLARYQYPEERQEIFYELESAVKNLDAESAADCVERMKR